jgi:glyoxylate carboligase
MARRAKLVDVSVQVELSEILTDIELEEVLEWYKIDMGKLEFEKSIKEFLERP